MRDTGSTRTGTRWPSCSDRGRRVARVALAAAVATGTARLTVDVGADGAVTRARVRTSSGDQRVDDMFGALAARLQVDAPERGPTTARITMGYSCAPNEAVTTIQLNQ